MLNFLKNPMVIIFAVSVVGCSSPKDANKRNFKKSINTHLAKECILLSLGEKGFPYKTDNKDIIKEYDSLVQASLLTSKDTTVLRRTRYAYRDREYDKVPAKEYALSDKGKKYYKKEVENMGFLGTVTKTGFCAGVYGVDEITNFTEPTPTQGYTISHVDYKYSPKKIEKWAQTESIFKSFPNLEASLNPSLNDARTLVLMNNGWIDASEIKK